LNTLRNLKQETLHFSSVDVYGGHDPPPLPLPEVHDHLLRLADVEREVVALVSSLLVMRPRIMVSYVNRAYRRGLSMQP